jgi:environmental stress-induced protein Ves
MLQPMFKPIVKIIRQVDITPTIWAGGKTTQLVIFPENSSYVDKNFDFRLSTATVETETSVFTQLEGVKRSLMVLKGSMILEHKGQYSKELNEFDIDNFLGDWKTTSYAKVTDFNLMTKGNTKGSLEYKKMQAEDIFEENIKENLPNLPTIAYYIVEGIVKVYCDTTSYKLSKEELILIQNNEKMTEISIKALQNTTLVRIFIQNNRL